jgi:hypothetical protein
MSLVAKSCMRETVLQSGNTPFSWAFLAALTLASSQLSSTNGERRSASIVTSFEGFKLEFDDTVNMISAYLAGE